MDTVWVAIAGIVVTGTIQVTVFAFFLGKMSQRVTSVEAKTSVSHEGELATIKTSLDGLEKLFDRMEHQIEDRFKTLEHVVRNHMQATINAQGTTTIRKPRTQ